MSTYGVPPLKDLKEQVLYAPNRVRIEQTNRAESLIAEIDDKKSYPFEWVCFKITKYRPDNGQAVAYPGRLIKRDLVQFIEEVSDSVDLRTEQFDEPVLFLDDLTVQYNVSAKTISRWRRKGLVSRRFRAPNGRRRVGFLKGSVDRFVAANRSKVSRSTRFSQLTDPEKQEIVRRARRMARYCKCCLSEVSQRIAKRLGRSPETVRYTIRNHDQRHPEDAVFQTVTGRLSQQDKDEIYRAFNRGVPVGSLGKRYCRTPSSVYRVINECRARMLIELDLSYMDSEEFVERRADKRFLGPMPAAPSNDKRTRTQKPPAGLPPYLARLYEIPLLTKEQEVHLFRKMNYLKFKASRLRDRLDAKTARSSEIDAIQKLVDEALAVKNQIIRSNLRLVVSIAKRHVGRVANFFELVSDGNMSLIRAVEKFNYMLGNKFSTYASWAIMKNFARTIPEENYRRDRFLTGYEEIFESAADVRDDEQDLEAAASRMKRSLEKILVRLDDRERRIIISRFGLDDSRGPETLEQVGRQFGVTKERIRQIEARALGKLKKFADEEKLDIAAL